MYIKIIMRILSEPRGTKAPVRTIFSRPSASDVDSYNAELPLKTHWISMLRGRQAWKDLIYFRSVAIYTIIIKVGRTHTKSCEWQSRIFLRTTYTTGYCLLVLISSSSSSSKSRNSPCPFSTTLWFKFIYQMQQQHYRLYSRHWQLYLPVRELLYTASSRCL